MLDAAQHAGEFANGLTRSTFERDLLRQYALARAVEVVGESASNVTEELQTKHPHIAWAEIKGMRNRLAHAYFDINLDVLWRAVTVELPTLEEQLQVIIDDYL
ncbi:MAG: DUF86 domain-containing protein [Chloroflexota bacterium]|nr:DUF86 domain-containing protein [Chloroflexota bacterium]